MVFKVCPINDVLIFSNCFKSHSWIRYYIVVVTKENMRIMHIGQNLFITITRY